LFADMQPERLNRALDAPTADADPENRKREPMSPAA
jgi:hypothetical protein